MILLSWQQQYGFWRFIPYARVSSFMMNHRAAHVHDPMQMAGAVHAYGQFQRFQQPYFHLMGYPTTSAFAIHSQVHPHLQSQQVQWPHQYNLFHAQMPVDGVPTQHEPALQASGWVQPFNEAELKVAGIMPYSYGMPRYGQVSLHLQAACSIRKRDHQPCTSRSSTRSVRKAET